MDRAHLAMEVWMVTVVAVLASMGASAMAPVTVPRGRLLKVPKVYNALITSDIPLLPSRAETAATAAVGSVLLYSSQLPVLLQPQAQGTTPQNHLDKLSQLQNQLQREEADQQSIQRYQQQLLTEHQLSQHLLASPSVQQQLFPERHQPAQQPYPPKQLPVQQLFHDRSPVPPQSQARQVPVQQQLFPGRFNVPSQLPSRQVPVEQQLYPERLPAPPPLPSRPLQQQLFPEQQQLAHTHHQPLQVQQVPVQHLSTEQLSAHHLPRQFDIPYQQKPSHQQFHRIDSQQKQLQLHHQKQQKQSQLSQFVKQQKIEQDTSYLPMPEMNSYQPPPSVHIDDIKNNKPSNSDIPDVPPPPLPVGKSLQPYSYNSHGLSPPPPTNHHVPYG